MLEKIIKKLGLVEREAWAVRKIFESIALMFKSFSVKKFFAYITVIAELIAMLALGHPTTPRGEELDLSDYKCVFFDDFDSDSLDTSVWEYRGSGARRGGFNASSQVSVKDGNMRICGEYLENGTYGEGWYTGAVRLKERYNKGYFEIRCIANDAPGFWSAFWLQSGNAYTPEISKGGPGGAEIDIFESLSYGNGKSHDAVQHAIHCAGGNGSTEGIQSAMLGRFYGKNIYSEYNTYGVEWNDDEYIFYINGVETIRSSFISGTSEDFEEVIVSLEIPSEESLTPLDKENYKTEMIIDYVKIYQK